jgi:Family of unknown function (DUF6058)
MNERAFTNADIDYVRGNYVTLEEACAGRVETPADVRKLIESGALPRPTYVLDDGTEMVPADYFRLVDDAGGHRALRAHFRERYEAAGGDPAELDEWWEGYLEGLAGVCLKDVTPEAMARKSALMESLTKLLEQPRPDDDEWRTALRDQVDEFDELVRGFAPDYDRSGRFPQPPSRDRLIVATRTRFPDVFEDVQAPPRG